MKTSNAAIFRENNIVALTDFFIERGEDVKRTATGSIAFPVVADDGEEGWIEVVVKIPKWTEDDDGYSRAEEYAQNVAEKPRKLKHAKRSASARKPSAKRRKRRGSGRKPKPKPRKQTRTKGRESVLFLI